MTTASRPAARQPRRGDGRVPPHNLPAEESLLGALLLDRRAQDDVCPSLLPEDFYKPIHQYVFAAIQALHQTGIGAVDVVTVAEELRRAGLLDEVGGVEAVNAFITNTPAISNAGRYRDIVRDAAILRQVLGLSGEIAELVYGEPDDVMKMIEDVISKFSTIELSPGKTVQTTSGRDFLANPPAPYDWVVPYIIEAGDRFLLTGGEGARKSMTLLQWAIMTAAGRHWWTNDPVPPRRTLFIDLELGEVKTRRRAALMEAAAEWASGTTYHEYIDFYSASESWDITTREGATKLASKIAQTSPAVVILGPLYRLTSGVARHGDIGGEDQAKQAAFALDKMREKFGCAIIAETHAAKGDLGRGRDLRPFGSAVWLRWPEFGHGLSKRVPDGIGYHPDQRALQPWRGDRDPREWPEYFDWSVKPPVGAWPLTARFDPSNQPSWASPLKHGKW